MIDWKARAVEQWTADPCGPDASGIEALMRARREFAPWMAEQLAYEEAAGLEVLDVGCGQGIDLCEFALAGAHVTGLDLTPRHIELAREHAAQAEVEVTALEGDAEQMPFAEESFDRVISNGVLHHTPDIEKALCEIRRVLRPGGKFTVILYNRNSFYYLLGKVLWVGIKQGMLFRERGMAGVRSAYWEKTSIGARPLVSVYSPREVRQMLRQAGFRKVETWVNPYRPEDSALTRRLPFRLPVRAGEFVIAHGVKPTLTLKEARAQELAYKRTHG